MGNDVQLITYADRLGGNLSGLQSLLDNEFRDLFGGVHVLPFFDPIDGTDAGFDPIDHTRVDPRLGNWGDVASLSASYSFMVDLIVNHVSADSLQFQDVQRYGRSSDHWELFLRKSDIFPDSEPTSVTGEEIRRIYRPRPGSPFTAMTLDDGSSFDFWTTFSTKQLDINVEAPAGRAYLVSILEQFAKAGIRELRLDAVGYAIKRRGTSCFMVPETFDFIGALSEQAHALGMQALVEVHAYYQTQIAIASQVCRVYDFALPPLVLHTLYHGDATAIKKWLQISPRNCVTVLDTHDGIGIMDTANQGDLEGLLTDDEINTLVEIIHTKTGGSSRKASGRAASNLDIYQVNSTYYDALGQSDIDYFIARAIQFFSPGTPQIYYVGLLAGVNDMDLVGRTGVGRDINRHFYSRDEIQEALRRPLVTHIMQLIRLRNEEPAFDGTFSMPMCERDELVLRWDSNDAYAQLSVELDKRCAEIVIQMAGNNRRYIINEQLLNIVAGHSGIEMGRTA